MPYYDYQCKKIHYRDKGEGRVLVLLTGNTSSSLIHDKDIEYFSKNFRVICPDYIGYGLSERVENFPTDFWWENAKMVIDLLKSINIYKYFLVGTSGGALISLNIAIMEPDSVNGLIADSIPGEYTDNKVLERVVNERNTFTESKIHFWERAHGQDWKSVIKKDEEMMIRINKKGTSLFHNSLSKIKCEVLLTGSIEDEIVPYIQDRIVNVAKQVKKSKIILFTKGKHPFLLTRKNIFRKEAFNFLKEL